MNNSVLSKDDHLITLYISKDDLQIFNIWIEKKKIYNVSDTNFIYESPCHIYFTQGLFPGGSPLVWSCFVHIESCWIHQKSSDWRWGCLDMFVDRERWSLGECHQRTMRAWTVKPWSSCRHGPPSLQRPAIVLTAPPVVNSYYVIVVSVRTSQLRVAEPRWRAPSSSTRTTKARWPNTAT